MTLFRPAILYIDDEQANLDTFRRAFGSLYLVRTCLSGEEALEVLKGEDFPLIIADQRMPGMTGIELCEKALGLKPQSIRMILTAYSEPELLLEAINRGRVHDYVVKPWRKSELKGVIESAFEDYKKRASRVQALEEKAIRADNLEREIGEIFDTGVLVGVQTGLKTVMTAVYKAAPTDSTILLFGETGTGKELIARAIHAQSPRSHAPFVPVHCAALSRTVLESELFGHERGAYTGADQSRMGRFEAAQGGTIFLDEVSEIPGEIQTKLLRVLQEREIQRVGSNKSIHVDVRLIAASNRDLGRDVKEGVFREDLYYRLKVIDIIIPPLRDRKGDIEVLAEHFLKKICRQVGKTLNLKPATLERLKSYDWPGNVRELQNIIERAVILSPGPEIEPDDLNLSMEAALGIENVNLTGLSSTVGSLRSQIQGEEIVQLTKVLRDSGGNISQAARRLGLARSTLFHRLKKYGMI